MGAVGSPITCPPSPKICRPRTDGAQYLIVSVALPIFPVAVSGGLVCAHAGLRATSRLNQTKKCLIDFLLFFVRASRATLHVVEKIRKRVLDQFHRIYMVSRNCIGGIHGEARRKNCSHHGWQ